HFVSPTVHDTHLVSLPTRRSSDLGWRRSLRSEPHPGDPAAASGLIGKAPPGAAAASWRNVPDGRHIPWGQGLAADQQQPLGTNRSEEHTSELQSRENLVCRLLPDK